MRCAGSCSRRPRPVRAPNVGVRPSLILRPTGWPCRAEKIGKQGGTVVAAAVVEFFDRADNQGGCRGGVERPVFGFHHRARYAARLSAEAAAVVVSIGAMIARAVEEVNTAVARITHFGGCATRVRPYPGRSGSPREQATSEVPA